MSEKWLVWRSTARVTYTVLSPWPLPAVPTLKVTKFIYITKIRTYGELHVSMLLCTYRRHIHNENCLRSYRAFIQHIGCSCISPIVSHHTCPLSFIASLVIYITSIRTKQRVIFFMLLYIYRIRIKNSNPPDVLTLVIWAQDLMSMLLLGVVFAAQIGIVSWTGTVIFRTTLTGHSYRFVLAHIIQ